MSFREEFIKILKKIAVENGFKDFTIEFVDRKKVGFICDVKSCQIKEGSKVLPLICKFLPDDKEHCEKYESYSLFLREVLWYNRILPTLMTFQKKYGLAEDKKGFQSFPKCYYSNFFPENLIESLIVLEDLNARDFQLKSMHGYTDFQHTFRVFQELGKLHGLGFALKHKQPDAFQPFQALKNRTCGLMTTDTMSHFAPRNVQLMSDVLEDPVLKSKIEPFKEDLWESVSWVMEKYEPCSIFTHGDCWINNVMFQYEGDSEIIQEICLLDWQHCFCGSPAIDLLNYFCTCVDSKERRAHLENFMECYHKSLADILEKFGLEVEEIFPMTLLKEQLKNFGIFGFAISTFAYPIKFKISDKVFEGKLETLNEEERNNFENYKIAIQDLVRDLVDFEFI